MSSSRSLSVVSAPGLVPVPGQLGDWVCTRLDLGDDDSFTVRFERSSSTDWLAVQVVPRAAPGKAFQVLDHCAVRYQGHLASPTPALREQVLHLVSGVAATLDASLARSPGGTIAEVLGRRHENARVVFGRDLLRQLLAPTIVEGAPVADGWVLRDVYPSSYARETTGDKLELVLDFQREADGPRALLVVSPRSEESRHFARTSNFSLSYLSLGSSAHDGAGALRALVAFALQLRDHPGLSVSFPDAASDVAPALPAAERTAPPAAWLNLAISSECSQSCAFCSIKDMAPPSDGGDALFARLAADLAAARQRGVEGIRVNGYDPLSYSRIVEVLEHATHLGFSRAHVFSPCTLLADRAFCEAIVQALPAERRFFVPLYATAAELHDAVVGRPGAHALVMRAIEHLVDLAGSEAIAILAVVTRKNLEALPDLARFARGRGLSFSAHMPYPSAESRADRYFDSTPRQSDVAEAFASAMRDDETHHRFPVVGVAPCVTFRSMQKAGVPLGRWLDVPPERPLLPGTEYKDRRFEHGAGRRESAAFVSTSIACPHEKDCALSLACPGELLRSYVELYGSDELAPVSLAALIDAK